jgi:hypothetical protein
VCTVAIVALDAGGYLLGHNRDESLARGRAVPPSVSRAAGMEYLAPTDVDAGGTWIAVNRVGLAVSLLNASDAHPERLPVRPESRGNLVRDLADAGSLEALHERIGSWSSRLSAIRAFHIVAVQVDDRSGRVDVDRHRWNGRSLRAERSRPPCLFVSALLDQHGAERERGRSWARLLGDRNRVPEKELGRWLASHDPEPGMLSTCVHRKDARTVSRTLVTVRPGHEVVMHYLDGQPCEPDSSETVYRLSLSGPAGGDQRR